MAITFAIKRLTSAAGVYGNIMVDSKDVSELVQSYNAATDEMGKLRSERDAFKAMIAVIKNAQTTGELIAAINATPVQCLSEIKAEAILQAVKFFKPARDIDVEALKSYADKIRQGGAK